MARIVTAQTTGPGAKGAIKLNADGSRRGTRKGIVIWFDDETFDQIRAIAVRKQTTFSAIVRELVEFGLEDIG